jgi:uncharacterized Zn finger protein (UPF0148 family)
MINTTCPRCESKFYTAISWPYINCPFCGFSQEASNSTKREEERATILRSCDLLKDGMRVSAQTMDISRKGLGLKVAGAMQLNRDDVLHVIIKDFEIDSDAQVIWVKRFDNTESRAGLRFR